MLSNHYILVGARVCACVSLRNNLVSMLGVVCMFLTTMNLRAVNPDGLGFVAWYVSCDTQVNNNNVHHYQPCT